MKKFRVLVACEESQAITIELRKLGVIAYSCDLQPCSGGHPKWHIQGDVLEQLDKGWHMIIGHPTCTYMTNSGVRWLWNEDGSQNRERWHNLLQGADFFNKLANAPIKHIVLENPIPHKYAVELIGRKYDQLVQPYMFGDTESKATCLWLKNLPKLVETNNVKAEWKALPKKESQKVHYMSPSPERAKLRSKTFKGMAQAIAKQYAEYLDERYVFRTVEHKNLIVGNVYYDGTGNNSLWNPLVFAGISDDNHGVYFNEFINEKTKYAKSTNEVGSVGFPIYDSPFYELVEK